MIYLLYKPSGKKKVELQASATGIHILEMICNGSTYKEIAKDLSISQSGVVKAVEKMREDNRCFDSDELVILYIDWKFNHDKAEADISK